MGLVIKDGKLLIKDAGLATATRPSEACDCCGDTPTTGCCCRLKQDGSTDRVITTTSEECSAYISPGVTDVVAVQFNPGKNCDDPDVECPEPPPPPSGICLYREDGLGTCTQYYVEGSGGGDCGGDSPEECYENQVGPHLEGSFPPGNGAYYFYYGVDGDEDSLYWEAITVTGEGPSGEYPATESDCIENVPYDCSVSPLPEDAFTLGGSSITCEEYAEQVNSLAPNTWENDLPPTHCRPVSSEEECTESTGTFCPDLTECPDDPSAGCPDPNRSNPLP